MGHGAVPARGLAPLEASGGAALPRCGCGRRLLSRPLGLHSFALGAGMVVGQRLEGGTLRRRGVQKVWEGGAGRGCGSGLVWRTAAWVAALRPSCALLANWRAVPCTCRHPCRVASCAREAQKESERSTVSPAISTARASFQSQLRGVSVRQSVRQSVS